jgi:hypothetical protein
MLQEMGSAQKGMLVKLRPVLDFKMADKQATSLAYLENRSGMYGVQIQDIKRFR